MWQGGDEEQKAKLILRDDMKIADVCIEVQVPSANGGWQTVEVLHPRDFWAIEAVNLSAYIPRNADFLVRLLWTAPHRLDYVGLDTMPQDSYTVRTAKLMRAVHSTEGNILSKVNSDDETYAELTPGQQIWLTFALPSSRPDKATTLMFYAEGHYFTVQ
jgi:hypothetical protein